jgi:transcriptional regulator with XRE-family HTH domain
MTPYELKAIREAAGLTQIEAAELLGILPRSYQRYEYGERKIPVPTERLFKLLTEDLKR